ncbi:aspartate kinase [Gloeobacter kilaueensis]|uniref:aspartate kinase n=1 Tax=Gloeobacter kilaueensis (strain ATCC BAA-2537 / CCAP 1431/1 / ULC 316 / JS1) TaxID=1183438 RepID=U5QLC0_GLOK1|nr:aspartate kinase [Gloeobacter kilaueensis]AGY59683.1 aspartate kinase [Gloeobacter kilaueensis JS1]
MGLIVQKYGGTSVGTVERMRAVAERIERTHRQGHDLIVVVSAMGHTTDGLLKLAGELHCEPDLRELDMLLTTGEQQSVALLSMALHALGCRAVSLTGAQVGIVTEPNHTRARILRIHTGRIAELLEAGYVVVVAGFQGICHGRFWEITTLGRGGSDTSAVALAAVLNASRCEIYTDVPGVLTTDPRLVKNAALLDEITSEEMLELASLGAQVLHPRAVELARNFAVPLVVRSSWSDAPGTAVLSPPLPVPRAIDNLETERPVDAVFIDNNQAKIALLQVPDRPGVAATLFNYLYRAGIDVDLIIQSIHHPNARQPTNDIAFTVQRSDLRAAIAASEAAAAELGNCRVIVDPAPTKVSIRGAGIIGRPGVVVQMFKALAEVGINLQMISTSETSLSCVIAGSQAEAAGAALCRQFNLREPIYEAAPVVSIARAPVQAVRGVALDTNQAQVAILQVPDQPGVAAAIFQCLAHEGIPVDMIVQSQRGLATNDIGFTVHRGALQAAVRALTALCQTFEGCGGVVVRDTVAKLSLVGAGIVGTPGVAARMFETLAALGTNIEMISTSTIKVSCIVDAALAEVSLQAVHRAFNLGSGAGVAVEGEQH